MADNKRRINESYWIINRDCDFIYQNTNRQNRQSINRIRKNLMSIYAAFRDLQKENLKLAEKNNERRLNYECE